MILLLLNAGLANNSNINGIYDNKSDNEQTKHSEQIPNIGNVETGNDLVFNHSH